MVLGALGMVFARNAVHSALCLAGTMFSLAVLYMIQNAPFLDDGTPLPTMYWLVDPDLSRAVARLEADGGVRTVQDAMDHYKRTMVHDLARASSNALGGAAPRTVAGGAAGLGGVLADDMGLGKTIQQLEWARHVAEHTSGQVLILAPLAVSAQTVREGPGPFSGLDPTHGLGLS